MESILAKQSIEKFKRLIPILADPMAHKTLHLEMDPSQDYKPLHLSTENGTKYKIVNNIPCMIPELKYDSKGEGCHQELWGKLQELEYETYRESPVGVFSIDDFQPAEGLSTILFQLCRNENCLDIGCGVLEKPKYMVPTVGDETIQFFGIDPFFGETERAFPFTQAIAENIPFKDKSFDNVLFSSSIDHVINPLISLNEASRVLKDDGTLFIWNGIRNFNLLYLKWKMRISPKKYNKHHQWAFTNKDLIKLVKKINFRLSCIIQTSKDWHLLIAKKKRRN